MDWDEEDLNDLAIRWYFLYIDVSIIPGIADDMMMSEWVEDEVTLKKILKLGGFTFIVPLSIFVDNDNSFDIWLDADGDIQGSELYCNETYG
ncbi:hypothetical protein [Pedobacter nyackensis]|uniref:hypothetical protein n=1 Tax=Pedobacter nyackensis TaxID=475255 RepID=UPI0029319936|nr:hypothetical protein [Pedobacter nyackensis]